MNDFYFNVSELNFHINIKGLKKYVFPFELANFTNSYSNNNVKKLHIIFVEVPSLTRGNSSYFKKGFELSILNNEIARNIWERNKNSVWLTYSPVSLFLFSPDKISYCLVINGTVGKKFLRNTIIRFVINHIVYNNGLFFHASGAVFKGRAFALTGFSNVGKTTAASLLANFADILSDDMIFCVPRNNKYYFYSSPFGKMISKNFFNIASALFFLMKGDNFRIDNLSKTSAIARYMVVHQKYILSLMLPLRKKILHLIKSFANYVRVYEMHMNKYFIDINEIDKVIKGDNTNIGLEPENDINWQVQTMPKIKKRF